MLLQLWRKDKKTALMVTHDVDEALFLSDRIVMMTNGPEAEVGDILEVKFPRPRDRKAVMEHPDYYRLREHLITFLEERSHIKKSAPSGSGPHGGGGDHNGPKTVAALAPAPPSAVVTSEPQLVTK